MSDEERLIADLLGAAPAEPDPSFRYDVFARVAMRARRQASHARAARRVAVMTAIGLGCALVQAAGLNWETAQPLIAASAGLGCAFLAAALSIHGPRALLAATAASARVGA
jgi:hypothetical protein